MATRHSDAIGGIVVETLFLLLGGRDMAEMDCALYAQIIEVARRLLEEKKEK